MKKILATTLAFVLLSTVFFVSKVPVRAAEDTTTTGKFLSATKSTPEKTNNVTYETDNSNVSKTFGTALKITPGNPGLLFFAESNPISGGKGMLMYAKTEADGKTTTPMFYITGENNLNAEANKDGKWYILTENDKSWQEKTYSNYGCELESGFEGYIYIPFSNYLKLDDTVKITGYNLYLLKGGSYENNNITLGQPIIATSDGIPNAEKIECGDWAYYYFGKKAPQYNGMITEAVAMDYDLNFNASDPTIPFDKENGIYPISGNHYKKRVRPAIDSSGFKLGSAFKFTTLTYTNEQGSCALNDPIYIKVKENDIAAHGMMLYVKTENDGKPYGIQVYINGKYQYSGSAYALKRGGSTWESVGFASQYGPVLESGFEGYVYFPFVGGFAELDNKPIDTYNLYLTAGNNSEGQAIYEEGRSIIVSKPVAITSDLGDNPPSPEMLKFGNETKSYFTESAPKVLGDANGDKTTDIRDLVRLKTVLAGLSEETENADVDNNGVIDSFDLAALRKILLGILG